MLLLWHSLEKKISSFFCDILLLFTPFTSVQGPALDTGVSDLGAFKLGQIGAILVAYAFNSPKHSCLHCICPFLQESTYCPLPWAVFAGNGIMGWAGCKSLHGPFAFSPLFNNTRYMLRSCFISNVTQTYSKISFFFSFNSDNRSWIATFHSNVHHLSMAFLLFPSAMRSMMQVIQVLEAIV